MTQQSRDGLPDDNKSILAERYGWALELVQYEIQRLWVIYGTFLLAETVLLGGVAQVLAQGPQELALVGSVIGLLLVIPWWATFEYTRSFYLLRIAQAREFEPHVATFLSEGHDLSRGIPIKGVKIGRFVRFLRPQRSGWFLMGLFAIAFAFIAYLAVR